jgi:A/G-specific adenine glycosylase
VSVAPARIAELLLPWFEAHGRRHLPWQQDPTPYRVWVSEVMLQQTQVGTVRPYFERFVTRFPDARALAAADIDDVLAHWSGLGYYARARNLHRAAREIVARHAGELPSTHAELTALPGIGRSTAAAILALSRGERHAILDGNAKRVLARVFLIEGAPSTAAVAKALWDRAEACTPRTCVAEYTQAIMDLGATVCTRANPGCDRCPLAVACAARLAGRVAELPARRPRPARRLRSAHMLIVRERGRVLLERRPPRGIWGGLWAPPEFPDAGAATAWASARFGGAAPQARRLPGLRHVFTHFDLDIEPWLLDVSGEAAVVADDGSRWHALESLHDIGLPAPVARILRLCASHRAS